MAQYLVNKEAQATGEHEIHTSECNHLPKIEHRQYLGYFNNCKEAIQAAKKYYSNVDGCYYCSRECNTR